MIGDDWVNDRLTFAKVSVAGARLFDLCKAMGREWDNLHPGSAARSLLLVTMDREDHIIGPAVLSDQLRRRGHSVQLLSNATDRSLCDRISRDRYDAVLISVSTWQALESAARAIREVRKARLGTLIVLGGSAIAEDKRKRPSTGADLTTNDIDEALDAIAGDDLDRRVAE
jgi:methylmalonyl-CoA mutase cobalamin-binding subunit